MSGPAEAIRWRDWNEESFLAAKQEEKRILLTLTATWCHWCHVMDQTSYADPQVIDLVNSQFIPVKVDVDRRPDISRRYNQGGFPTGTFQGQELAEDGGQHAGGGAAGLYDPYRLISYLKLSLCCPKSRTSTR